MSLSCIDKLDRKYLRGAVFEAYPVSFIFIEKGRLTVSCLVFTGVGIGGVLSIIVKWCFSRLYHD